MEQPSLPALAYDDDTRNAVPVLTGERNLQTITAEPWAQVSDQSLQLEGLCFDREENLYFVNVFGGQLYKMTLPEKDITTIMGENDLGPGAVKIHKDGRLFLCCLGDFAGHGSIISIDPDGSNKKTIIPDTAGYCIDDLVFDRKGGFYFTDFRGHATHPLGGVYYLSPDFQDVTPIIQNLAVANGVALSTDERELWVTETNANRLHHVELEEDGITIPPFGASIPYYFTGRLGPDSCCIDRDNNLYVAMYEQGRILVFNPNGYPIGQILLPGREDGHMLRSTHPAFVPGTDQLIICSNDGNGDQGSWLYTARGFAKGHLGYQFQE